MFDVGFHPVHVHSYDAEVLYIDIMGEKTDDKRLRQELRENGKGKKFLKEEYGIDRLGWVSHFLTMLYTCGGVPKEIVDMMWNLFGAIRGEIPDGFPMDISWAWFLHKYHLLADRQYVDKMCKEFVERHPETVERIRRFSIPSEFKEISGDIRFGELFRYVTDRKLTRIINKKEKEKENVNSR